MMGLADAPRQPQQEDQDFRHGLVEFCRNFIAELDIRQCAGQHLVLLDRDAMLFGDLDDLLADRALALGDHPRRAGPVVMQRDRELFFGNLAFGWFAHSARSRKWPALAETSCNGAPSRITISPGVSSARASAWLRCETPARN